MLKNKKIAVVFTADIIGGHELMAIEHIKKQLKKNIDITCFIPMGNKKLADIFSENEIEFQYHLVKHKRMEIIHSFVNFIYLYKAISFLNKIKKSHEEIIIVQGDIELGSGFVNASRLTSTKITSYIPYAHTFRKMGSKVAWLKDALSYFTYGYCRNYITICETFKYELEKKTKGATVKVLKNFVSPAPIEQIRNVGYVYKPNKDKLRILMAGRVYFRQKGQDKLLYAASKMDIDVDILVIGDGPDLNSLKEIARNLPANINVQFIGWKNNVWEHAYEIDLVVMPSNFEGVPLIMLESLERNVPIIAPARDGMLDYLSDEFLYEVGSDFDECESLRKKLMNFSEYYKNR
ncbi:glycosyltransferase [Rahnella sp. L72c]|uniref:Glycosyltransferase n=1 Tax=Rahnella perminowiae TaxID=2816244 RepID=A0ABS6L8D9_9GAMM|nr:glycosyltransferase [Rahnella perminowiae]MBU9838118.1 glycosyltransferase [Rahnella perminowiae]